MEWRDLFLRCEIAPRKVSSSLVKGMVEHRDGMREGGGGRRRRRWGGVFELRLGYTTVLLGLCVVLFNTHAQASNDKHKDALTKIENQGFSSKLLYNYNCLNIMERVITDPSSR